MKLVINSKRVYLHKNDLKRRNLRKTRVKTFTEWRQDSNTPGHSAACDDAIHEECMKLIGLPTSVNNSDVAPLLEGGRLFSEVLGVGETPRIFTVKRRKRKPPEQAANQVDGNFNGENLLLNSSSELNLACDNTNEEEPPVRNEDSNATTIKNDAINNEYKDDGAKNDLLNINDGVTSILIDSDPMSITDEVKPIINEHKDITTVNNVAINDLFNINDEVNSVPIDSDPTPFNDESLLIYNEPKDSSLDKNNTANDLFNISNEDNNSMIIDFDALPVNNDVMPIKDVSKNDLLNINDRDSNLMPIDNDALTTNDEAIRTINDPKDIHVVNDVAKKESSNIDEEDMPIDSDKMSINKEPRGDTMTRNKIIEDDLLNSSENLPTDDKNNLNSVLEDVIDKMSPTDTKNDQITNSTNSLPIAAIDNSDNVEDKDMVGNDSNNDKEVASSSLEFCTDSNRISKGVKATTEIISVDNNTESIPKNKEQSTVDLDKIDEDKEDCILVNNKESELIDLTCFNANKGPNAVVDQALDLTFYNENKDPNSLDNNSCIDLTFYNDSEEQKMVIDTIISQDNSIIDLTSYDNKVSLADAIKAEQSRILDIIKTNNTLANLKQEPSTSKYVKPRIVIKMEVEPQASTSDMDASFMKLVRRKGKRRQADGEECEEEESTRRQNKTKGRLEYISMADLAKNVGDEDDGEDDEEMSIAQTYAEYKPRKLTYGRKHPDPVVETASLSSVEPADVTYCLSLPDDTIRRGLLSALQLEAVVYASQAHEKLLPDGSRAGFLIGDGAGVGKGRTVAGIAFDNYLKGRKRALWFSVSRDLKYDAERDLRDIGAPHITAYNIVEMKYDDDISSEINGDVEEGVIFSTYMSLVSKNNSGKKYSNRLDQLLQWCGPDFEGVIIFDECHKAKNLHTAQTQTGKNVLELQNRLPKARVVYASATGASEPHNMAYMVRLGIWGEGTPFKDFGDFNRAVEKRGVSAMELVAMDIKQRGVYIARQLSFQGVTVRIIHVPMNEDFKKVYDDSTKLWSKARIKFIAAIDQNSATISPKQIGNIWRQFWATHQRFFKYLCIAAKVEAAVQCASAAVRAGSCAVLGLQGTGEARTLDYMQHCDTDLTDFISTAEGVFQALVEKQFPTEDYGTKNKKPKLSSQSQCSLSYSESMREELLLDIKKLGARLPKNTLDELIDKLGGPSKVAEMTGRIGRMVHRNGGTVYESRTWGLIKQENVNMAEKQLFMDGKKDIAIISEAASSGISLQSDRRALNKKPRVHITLELPWSADQAVQQFGRTHRSNQVNAPEYIFLISDLAGERRFASTVAKRLESLGALTHGDRRATETRDLSQFNIDNKYGRLALSKMMGAITGTDPDHEVLVSPPTNYPGDFISDVTNALREVQFYEERNYDTSVFLNRILGIPVDLQNALFQYFTETLAAVVQLAKRNGKFDMGILDLDSSSGRRVQRLTSAAYCRQHATGSAVVVLHTLLSQRGLDWAQAEKIANSKSGHERTFYRTRAGKNKQIIMCISVFSNVQNSVVWVYSPSTGQAKETQLLEDIKKNHSKVTKLDVARAEWDKQYNRALKSCRHEQCKDMSICMMSRTVRTYFILSGSLLSVWTQVEDILLSGRLLSKKERAAAAVMKIIRVNIDDGHKIIGILIPKKHVARLQEELSRDPKDLPDPTKDLPQTKQAIDKKPAVSLPSHSKENRPTNVLPHNPPSRSKDDMLNE